MGRNLFHLYAFVKLFSHQTRILHIYPQPALAVDIWLAARCNQGEATGELPATSATLVGQPSVGFVCFFFMYPQLQVDLNLILVATGLHPIFWWTAA